VATNIKRDYQMGDNVRACYLQAGDVILLDANKLWAANTLRDSLLVRITRVRFESAGGQYGRRSRRSYRFICETPDGREIESAVLFGQNAVPTPKWRHDCPTCGHALDAQGDGMWHCPKCGDEFNSQAERPWHSPFHYDGNGKAV
jgi:hypothetical protein